MALSPTNRSAWRGVPLEERQRYMAQEMHVHHPSFVSAVTEIKRRMRRCINENTGSAILLLAPSGAGKTHTRTFFKKRWPDRHTDTSTKVPVVAFDVPTNPTALSMGEALLRSMGDTCRGTNKAARLLDRIVHLLPQIGTELILIDNVQDVPEKRKQKGVLEIGGWIRRLVDEGRRLVVLLGTSSSMEIVASNSQLRRRASKRLEMDYFHFKEDEEKAQFMRFLKEVEKLLPLAEPSNLSSPETALSLYHATFGIQDYIFQILTEAVGVAVNSGKERIEQKDLEDAFHLVFQDAAKNNNPFAEGGPRRPLTMEGEPFFNWYDASNPPLECASMNGIHERGDSKQSTSRNVRLADPT